MRPMHVPQALEIFLKVPSKLQTNLRSNDLVVRALFTLPNKLSPRQPQTIPPVDMKIWSMIGVVPFNRKPLKDVIATERARAAAAIGRKKDEASVAEVIVTALNDMYGGKTPSEKVAARASLHEQGRVYTSDVWRLCNGNATADEYSEALEAKAQAKAAQDAAAAAKRADRAAKAGAAAALRRELAESHWVAMTAVQFDESRFPKTQPKILSKDSCVAILEVKFGAQFGELQKLKLPELRAKLEPKLIVLRPRQRRQRH